jgi:putative addiction module component (TIGR02574 family)
MPPNLDDIQAEAMKLSIEERAELAHRLWASLEPQADVDAAWAVEIERRVRQLETGEVETIPLEIVIGELRNKFG